MENLLFYFFLLLGLFGIVLCLLGIILGVIGRIKIRKNPALISSKVRANAGIFIGIFALFISFIMSIALIYLNFFRDSDSDGVLNKNDYCVNEYGDYGNNGCPWPDTDGDSVLDKDDACPDTYGDGADGCPEYSYEEEYVEEASTYKTVCPYCSNTEYETQYNITWTCGSCGEDFYSCYNNRTSNYGIYMSWMNDGACDCSDCSDE